MPLSRVVRRASGSAINIRLGMQAPAVMRWYCDTLRKAVLCSNIQLGCQINVAKAILRHCRGSCGGRERRRGHLGGEGRRLHLLSPGRPEVRVSLVRLQVLRQRKLVFYGNTTLVAQLKQRRVPAGGGTLTSAPARAGCGRTSALDASTAALRREPSIISLLHCTLLRSKSRVAAPNERSVRLYGERAGSSSEPSPDVEQERGEHPRLPPVPKWRRLVPRMLLGSRLQCARTMAQC